MSEHNMPINRRRIFNVDNEEFAFETSENNYTVTWLSGPNPGYGFSGSIQSSAPLDAAALEEAARSILTDDHVTQMIKNFLAEIDPETGYLAQ